jgi:nicotinamidase-related amidase
MRPTERMTGQFGALLVVDVQDKLLRAIPDRDAVIANTLRLVKAAQILHMPVWATEQYPQGLGPTVAPIAELIPQRPAKTTFHCCAVPQLLEQLYGRRVRHVTLAGIEAHVCVAQTALELLNLGFCVQVPADAVGSRHKLDWEFALRRLERAGAVVSSSEAVLFEWTERSDRPEFKAISALVKEADLARSAAEASG